MIYYFSDVHVYVICITLFLGFSLHDSLQKALSRVSRVTFRIKRTHKENTHIQTQTHTFKEEQCYPQNSIRSRRGDVRTTERMKKMVFVAEVGEDGGGTVRQATRQSGNRRAALSGWLLAQS